MKNLLTTNKQMKKLLFSLVAMGFLATTLISCQSNQKGTAESGDDTTKKAASATSAAPVTHIVPPTTTKTGNENLDVSPEEKIEIPESMPVNHVIKLKGKGVSAGFMRSGDFLIVTHIDMPKKLSKDAKKIVEELKNDL